MRRRSFLATLPLAAASALPLGRNRVARPRAIVHDGITRDPRRAWARICRVWVPSGCCAWRPGSPNPHAAGFGRYECIEHRMNGADRVYAAASEMRADGMALAY
jgi:hypothetical protein